MLIKLAICLFLATQIHAGVIRDDNNIDSASTDIVPTTYDPVVAESIQYFNTSELMKKLSAFKLTCSDIKELTGCDCGSLVTQKMAPFYISKGVLIIARKEFRAALHFGSAPYIRTPNNTMPSEEEFASAHNLYAYLSLKETRSDSFISLESLYNTMVAEYNMRPVFAFLDKKFPEIRILFRRRSQEIARLNQGKMNKEVIDRWISELRNMHARIAPPIYENVRNLNCGS